MDPPEAGPDTVRENLTDVAIGTELTYTCSEGFYIPPDQVRILKAFSIDSHCLCEHYYLFSLQYSTVYRLRMKNICGERAIPNFILM